MTSIAEIEKSKKFLEIITIKASKNEIFKEELINNPKDTIEKIPGVKLKNSTAKIVVEDQTNHNILYLNIPRKVNLDDYELNEEELESISGGTSIFGVECLVVINLTGDIIDGWNEYQH